MYFPLRLLIAVLLLPTSLAMAEPIGRVQFVVGVVNLESTGGTVRPLKKGDSIEEGDAVVSERLGQAQLVMFDEAVIAVRPDTRLRFETYRFSGKPDGSEEGIMSLVRGGFRTITGLIGRARPTAYRVKTPTATIGIRGTDHEPLYIPPPAPGEVPIGPPGTYNKVNSGQTFIENASGRIDIGPNQAGFAPPTPTIAPIRLPQIPAFMRGTPPVGSDGAKRGVRENERRGQGQKETANKRDQKEAKDQGGQEAVASAQQSSGSAPATEQSAQSSSSSSASDATSTSAGATPAEGTAQASATVDSQATVAVSSVPVASGVPLPVPALVKGALDLTTSPTGAVAAPKGFAAAGGDLSDGTVGSGAGVVGDSFGVMLDGSGNLLSVAGNRSSYSAAGAPLVQQGGALVAGIPVRWGIYAGGQFTDERGSRSPSFFHFMGAPNATTPGVLVPVLTAGGPLTFTALPGNNEYTKPIAEDGAVGGRVGLKITLGNVASNPSVTAYNLSIVDANGRTWVAGLSGGAVDLGTFLRGTGAPLNVGCNGCPLPSGFGSAHGAAIGSTTVEGVISSYDLKAGKAGVTGSVLAR